MKNFHGIFSHSYMTTTILSEYYRVFSHSITPDLLDKALTRKAIFNLDPFQVFADLKRQHFSHSDPAHCIFSFLNDIHQMKQIVSNSSFRSSFEHEPELFNEVVFFNAKYFAPKQPIIIRSRLCLDKHFEGPTTSLQICNPSAYATYYFNSLLQQIENSSRSSCNETAIKYIAEYPKSLKENVLLTNRTI